MSGENNEWVAFTAPRKQGKGKIIPAAIQKLASLLCGFCHHHHHLGLKVGPGFPV
uniref:Uncharacterized protein n=1 Tax=Anolis carolinensis TaxID=28377 RepID=A0A803SRA3_ANOCA